MRFFRLRMGPIAIYRTRPTRLPLLRQIWRSLLWNSTGNVTFVGHSNGSYRCPIRSSTLVTNQPTNQSANQLKSPLSCFEGYVIRL